MDVVFWDVLYVELLIIANLNRFGFISAMVANVDFTYRSLYLKKTMVRFFLKKVVVQAGVVKT